MKLQVAYDTLAIFLNQNHAGLAEQEALKSLAAYCKGVETKRGNGNNINLQPIQSYSQPKTRTSQPAQVSPTVSNKPQRTLPSFASPANGIGPMTSIPPATTTRTDPRGRPWTQKEESDLLREYRQGMSACDMADAHKRTIEAIAARLKKMGVIKERKDLHGYEEYRKAIGTYRSMP